MMPAGVALPGNTGAHTVQENANTAEPQRKENTSFKHQHTRKVGQSFATLQIISNV